MPGIPERAGDIKAALQNENFKRNAKLNKVEISDLTDRYTFEERLYNIATAPGANIIPEGKNPSSAHSLEDVVANTDPKEPQGTEASADADSQSDTGTNPDADETPQTTPNEPKTEDSAGAGTNPGTDEIPQTDASDNTGATSDATATATQTATSTSISATQEPTAISSAEVTPSVTFTTTIVDPKNAVTSVTEAVGEDIVKQLVEVISREVNPDKSLTVSVSAEADEILEPAMREIDNLYDTTIKLLHLELKQRPNGSLTKEVEDAAIAKFAYIEESRALAKNSFKNATMEVALSRNGSEYLDGIAQERLNDLRRLADDQKKQREYEKEQETNAEIKKIEDARQRAKEKISSKASEAVKYILDTKPSFSIHNKKAATALEKTKRGQRLDNIVEDKRPVTPVSPEELAAHYSSLLQQAEDMSSKITSVRGFKEDGLVIFLSKFDIAAPSNKKGMFKSLFDALNSAATN